MQNAYNCYCRWLQQGQYILPVKKSGIWRDFVLIPANDCKTDVTDVMFRRDSNKGDFLHSVVLNIPLNRSKVENAVDSPGRRSVQIHMVDAETQAELHVAYSEATYMLEPPCDTSRRKSAVILRREVAKVSPSPNRSFSIRLDDVNEETDQENRHQLTRRENMHRDIGEDSGDNAGTIEVDVTAKDKNEIAYEKLLSKQRLLKLVQQLAPAEAFSLTLGLGVPDVRKKQEEHQEKNVVTVYYNLLVYWLETMMGNDKQEAFNKLVVELKDVRKDLADSLEHEFNDICKATVQA